MIDEGEAAFRETPVELDPAHERAHLTGVQYGDFLVALEQTLQAQLYFEIGTRDGASLKKISCGSVAVDPDFQLAVDVVGAKPACHLYQMTSDEFFQTTDATGVLANKISFAFLDGMHLIEYLLRDFINTEKHCAPGSIIAVHDCYPINLEMAEREWRIEARRSPRKDLATWWTGDVWKLLPILRRYRPDIRLMGLDCAPTGLVICTNLNPESRVLEDNYSEILAEFGALELSDFGLARLYESFPLENSLQWHDISRLSQWRMP